MKTVYLALKYLLVNNVGAKRSISKKAAYVRLESDGAFR
ncbi:hypothetical protein ApDm4_0798 [Acetobacter pomorum]|nr:hypothetical protein ApDm4_0798 [Acetobacter pomorum]